MQRKAISPRDFADLGALAEHVLSFQDRYKATAEPFDWTYTRGELNTYLKPLADHDAQQAQPGQAA